MTFKETIIAYFPHKRMGNTGNKKIIFFAIMKPLSGVLKNANQNTKNNILCYNETFKWCVKKRQSKHKKGAYYHGKQKHSSECIFFIRAQRIAQHHLESG
ncbi:hypothetical protein VN0948_14550 [Helicobacter pylori]